MNACFRNVVWPLAGLVVILMLVAGPVDARQRKSSKKAERQRSLVLVMNYPYQITGTAKTRIHTTLFKPDFTPAKGAVVEVNDKQVGVADDNGTCIFEYTPGANKSHQLKATLTEGKRRWRVRKSFSSNARTASFRSDQLFVYTDRGVYNPGDDIQVRLLAWELEGDYKALSGKEVKLMLQTASGQLFAAEELETNEFGIAATKLPLAEHMPVGDYELVVLYNKARETARLRVERFVPPVMEIDHDLKRFLTPAQKELAVTAKVRFFAGGVPEEATLTLAATTAGGQSIFEARNMERVEAGRYRITLAGRELDKIRKKTPAEQPFKFVLTATDRFQRTSKVTRDVVYTERPYRAVLEFDKDDYPAGEQVKLQAKVVDLDGKPARGIELLCTVAEFKIKTKAKTDDNGVAEFTFAMGPRAGTAVVTSPVMGVPLGQKAVRFNPGKPMTSKVSEPPRKQGIQTHITVTFDPKYRPIEKVVHVDFTDISGALVMSTTIPVSRDGDGYRAEGTVTADTWGTMLANLYVCAVKKSVKSGSELSIKNVGFITEGQHVTLHPDATAEIRIDGLKPTVRPGERLDVTVHVKTAHGGDAAVGAAVVDQAVVSLLDPLEVSPVDHFYNPQRKVISTGGAGVLTWPVVDRNWGNPWRDIAYTNWGWKAPGEWVAGGGAGEALEMEGAVGSAGSGMGGGGDGGVVTGVGGIGLGAKASKKSEKKKMMVSKSAMVKMLAADAAPAAEPMMAEETLADEDASGEALGRDRSRHGETARTRPKRITIRTDFPETALWEPLLKTKNGATRFAIRFPDAITVQRLTLVASDKAGGLGIVHQPVAVRQDLFVQADVPATLTLGDEVQVVAVVQNLSGRTLELQLNPIASGLEIVGDPEQSITVADGEAVPVTWTVRATFCGDVSFGASAFSADVVDEERKSLRVLPAGEPLSRRQSGTLTADKPFVATFERAEDATWTTAFLNISFPNAVPAIQAWQAMAEMPMAFVGVSGVASRAILDAALYRWGRDADRPREWQQDMRARLLRAAAELVAVQNKDGSWGWFYMADASNDRDGYVISTYLSGYALRALVEVAELGLLENKEALAKGSRFLLDARNAEGLWAPVAFFWEVHAPETDWALSGDLAEVLFRAQKVLGADATKELRKLQGKLAKYLATAPDDVGGMAHGLSALAAWQTWQGKGKSDVEKGLQHLLTLKRKGYWEPHWYHAYGGMVELNAQILALLRTLNDKRYETVEYEVVTWLLSTREAWGAWHNEIGTANAVRALLAGGAGMTHEIPSTVTVEVNGRTVTTVKIDPDDPFFSAANLRFVELTNDLVNGENRVTVRYDGKLEAPVTLESRQWGGSGALGVVDSQSARLELARQAATEAKVGEPVAVHVEVKSTAPVAHVQVTDTIPSNATVDKRSLEKLVKEGTILGYQSGEGEVAFFLGTVKESRSFSYRILSTRVGTGLHRGAKAVARYNGDVRPARTTGEPLSVM